MHVNLCSGENFFVSFRSLSKNSEVKEAGRGERNEPCVKIACGLRWASRERGRQQSAHSSYDHQEGEGEIGGEDRMQDSSGEERKLHKVCFSYAHWQLRRWNIWAKQRTSLSVKVSDDMSRNSTKKTKKFTGFIRRVLFLSEIFMFKQAMALITFYHRTN